MKLPILLALLLTASVSCRVRSADQVDGDLADSAENTTQTLDHSSPPLPPPCVRAPGSFAEVTARVEASLVTLLGDQAEGSGTLAALPTLSPASTQAAPSLGPSAPSTAVPLGTGVRIGPDGTIVTSLRVAGDATIRTVELGDGRRVEASLRGIDPDLDLAVYVCAEATTPPVELADHVRPRPGDWVAVISRPYHGGVGATAALGVIGRAAAPHRVDLLGPVARLLRLSLPADVTTFGGAAVDTAGRLVGLVTSIGNAGASGTYVVPAAELRRATGQILAHGRTSRSWLGLWARPFDPARDNSTGIDDLGGLLVTRVVPGGPADQGGLAPDDVVLDLDGQRISTTAQLSAITTRIEEDQEVSVVFVRQGQRRSSRLRPAPTPQ